MADIIKVLGQRAAAADTTQSLYIAPALSSVTVSTLVVCNRTINPRSFKVSVWKEGDVVSDEKQFIFYDMPLGANATLTATLGLTLAERDEIKTWANATGLSFNLFGVETY